MPSLGVGLLGGAGWASLLREVLVAAGGDEAVLAPALAVAALGVVAGVVTGPAAPRRDLARALLVLLAAAAWVAGLLAVRAGVGPFRPGDSLELGSALAWLAATVAAPSLATGAAGRAVVRGGGAVAALAGAAAGALLADLLRPHLDPTTLVAGLGGVALLAAAAGRVPRLGRALVAAAGLALLAIAPRGAAWTDAADRHAWRQVAPHLTVVAVHEAPGARTAWLAGRGLLVAGRNGRTLLAPPEEIADRLDAAFAVLQAERPRSALLIGPARPALVRALGDLGVGRVETVPALPLPPLPADEARSEGVSAPSVSARRRVSDSASRHDLVLVEAPEAGTLSAARFHTAQFLDACGAALAPRGVLVARLPARGPRTPEEARALAPLLRAYSSFGRVLVAPSGAVVASQAQAPTTLDAEILARRWRARGQALDGVTPELFQVLVHPEAVREVSDALVRAPPGGADPHSDGHPVAWLPPGNPWTRAGPLGAVPLGWAAGAVLLVLGALCLRWRRVGVGARRGLRVAASAPAALGGYATGTALFAAALGLQTLGGDLYGRVGAWLAAGILGLAVGLAQPASRRAAVLGTGLAVCLVAAACGAVPSPVPAGDLALGAVAAAGWAAAALARPPRAAASACGPAAAVGVGLASLASWPFLLPAAGAPGLALATAGAFAAALAGAWAVRRAPA